MSTPSRGSAPLRPGEVGRTLDVMMNGVVIGTLESPDPRRYTLTYSDEAAALTRGLSCSLPIETGRHTGQVVSNWLAGLLPDRAEVVDRWRATYDIKRSDPYALLWHVGQDVAGAASFVRPGDIDTSSALEPVTDEQIADRIRGIVADATAWMPFAGRGQFSLAGAQGKFALARTEQGWAHATGRQPTTHIFKPAIPGLPDQDLNEHMTMKLAALVGLPVAPTQVRSFAGQRVLIVTRFDRRQAADGTWLRVHQEDTVQARGLSMLRKFESPASRDVIEITQLLRDEVTGDHAAEDVATFVDAVVFNWLVLGTDAHARNYSLLHSRTATRLAPLYDLNSFLPYRDGRQVNLAMKIGFTERDPDKIDRESLDELARDCRLDPVLVVERARTMAETLLHAGPGRLEESSKGWDSPLPELFADRMAEHVRACLNRL